jgi:hypothetical protein
MKKIFQKYFLVLVLYVKDNGFEILERVDQIQLKTSYFKYDH